MDKHLIEAWMEAKKVLDAAKKNELDIRNAIATQILEDKFEGSITEHHGGFKVTATARVTRSLDKSVLEAVWDSMPERERECIEYKPSLKLSSYRPLEGTGSILEEAVTIKPALSSLKVIPEEVE